MSTHLSDIYERAIRAEIDSYKRGRTMLSTTNCPNCGAPIVADKCEYCETVFSAPKLCSHDDILGMYKNVERLLASGAVTVNEARELLGFNRIDTPEWHAPMSPVEAYKQGEIVRYCGVLRRSLINSNVYPPAYDSVWETVQKI